MEKSKNELLASMPKEEVGNHEGNLQKNKKSVQGKERTL